MAWMEGMNGDFGFWGGWIPACAGMTVIRGAEWRLGVSGRLAYWGGMGYYSAVAAGGFTAVHPH